MGRSVEDVIAPVLMQGDRQKHNRELFDMRGNLVHAGRASVASREARLMAFLERYPDWRERALAQTERDTLARILRLNPR